MIRLPCFVMEKEMEVIMNQMLSNIVVAILGVLAVAAGIYGWWVDKGGSSEDPKTDKDKKNTEIEEIVKAEKDKKN